MANKFTISTTFKAHDRMTKTVKGMNQVVGRLGVLTKRVAKVGIIAFGVALGLVTREFVNFDQAITSSSAKFGDLNLATAKGQKQLKELGRIARDVGAATQFSATEAAQGLDYLAMAGFNVEQAIAGLPRVIDLATVGKIDLARATDISSDALGAFNMMVKDSSQLQTNMTRINDVMAKTITSSNTDLEQLFETIKKGAPAFTMAGQSIESFNALAGAMANAGIKGTDAGTSLKNVMLRLAQPAGEAGKILKELGVRTADSSGNFRDVIDILADFEKGLKGMGTEQRTAALKTIFGQRTITGISVLLATGSDALREYRKSLEESTGAAAKMAKCT
ncbi:MAG TPA: phage tail tape measure protein [bacterium]|nr:phage tail tape measure protein [bacterium]